MRKLLLPLFAVLFIGLSINAQNARMPIGSSNNMNPVLKSEGKNTELIEVSKPDVLQRNPKVILGEITGLTDRYVSGTTFDLTFSFNYMSYDYEYVKGISIQFPEGVSVNSATDIAIVFGDPLNYDGTTGDGTTVVWGTMEVAIGGGAYLFIDNLWTVNITVDQSFSGDMVLDWIVNGGGHEGTDPTVKSGIVKLVQETGTDIGMVQILPLSVLAGETIYPEITVSYAAASTIDDFTISFTANDGTNDVYSSVKTVSNAGFKGFGEDVFVLDNAWTVAEGEYTISATINYPDNNIENNSMEFTFKSGYYNELYAGNVTGKTYNIQSMETGALTQVGTMASSPFPASDEFIIDRIYRICTNGVVGTVTPFGDFTEMGKITIPGWNQSTGMAYDWVNDKIYVLLSTTTTSGIYTLDLSTFTITQVGETMPVGNMYAMDMANDGMLYCINTTNLYQFDPATGEYVDIGLHGLNLTYVQDVTLDPYTNTLYTITSETDSRFRYGYYNLGTGLFNEIALMDIQEQYSTLVCTNVPKGPLVISTSPAHQAVDMVPDNPVSAMFNTNLTAIDLSGVSIVDEDGVTVANVVATVNGKALNIAHNDFDFRAFYMVTIPAGSISDGTNTNVKDIIWMFETGLDPDACNEPSQLWAETEPYEAILSWKENGAGVSWDIKWGAKGFDFETEGNLIEATTDNPYTLSNLTPAVEYDFYVRANCGGDEHSIWSDVLSFRTLPDCDAGILVTIESPWQDGFEDEYLDCWNVFDMDLDGFSWWLDDYEVYEGNFSASHPYDFSDQEGWLVTPKLSIPNDGGNYLLTFMTKSTGTSYYDYNGVWISTGDVDPLTGDYIEVWNPSGVSAAWSEVLIPLDDYVGEDIYIAFVYKGYAAHDWFVDNVSVGHFDKIDAQITAILTPSNSEDLSDQEQVTITVKNNGSDPISNFSVSLELDGEPIATETFTGSIASLSQGNFTFDATIDLSEKNKLYTIIATVELEDDQDASNDALTKVVRHIGAPIKLYAYRIFEGQSYDFEYSFIAFESNTPGTVYTANSYKDGNNVPSGGEYANGKLYLYTRKQLSPYEAQNFVVLDASDWSVISTTSISKEGYDMAYDHTSGTMYTIHRNSTMEYSELYTVNLENGALTLIGSMERHLWTLACNLEGQMFAVDADGNFCSVDKGTGATTLIGATGIRPSYIQSMAFDHNSGRLFWAMTNTGEQGRLMEIDTATGHASNLGTLGDNIEAVALYTEYPAVPDLTLASLTVSEGTLSPKFNPYITDYTVDVVFETEEITISAVAASSTASVSGTGVKDLVVGENIVDIRVTEGSGSKTYKVNVKRADGVAIDAISGKLQVYPNPTQGLIYIKNGKDIASDIKVYDLQGVLLIQEQGDKIDLSRLINGLYIIDINGTKVKIIKE